MTACHPIAIDCPFCLSAPSAECVGASLRASPETPGDLSLLCQARRRGVRFIFGLIDDRESTVSGICRRNANLGGLGLAPQLRRAQTLGRSHSVRQRSRQIVGEKILPGDGGLLPIGARGLNCQSTKRQPLGPPPVERSGLAGPIARKKSGSSGVGGGVPVSPGLQLPTNCAEEPSNIGHTAD